MTILTLLFKFLIVACVFDAVWVLLMFRVGRRRDARERCVTQDRGLTTKIAS